MKTGSLVLLLALSVLREAPAQPPAQSQPEVVSHGAPVTFSSRVNLVSVPVVVRDRDGHAVGGLHQEDFQLFDKGKPQLITKFSIQTNATAAPPLAERSAAFAAAETAEAAKPELPDRYVAYFFDDIHMQPGDLLNARQAANHHLDTALDPNTRAGVFTTSGRFTQVFTNDVAKLHDALNRIQPWTSINDKMECLQISYYIADYLINQEHSLSPFGLAASSSQSQASPLAQELLTEAKACSQNPTSDGPARYLWTTGRHIVRVVVTDSEGHTTAARNTGIDVP
jgi:hypothetical protein